MSEEILEMHVFGGLTFEEIAQELGVSQPYGTGFTILLRMLINGVAGV